MLSHERFKKQVNNWNLFSRSVTNVELKNISGMAHKQEKFYNHGYKLLDCYFFKI